MGPDAEPALRTLQFADNSEKDKYNRKYKDYVYGRCKYKSTWKNKEYLRR